jgi:hypothetical protein
MNKRHSRGISRAAAERLLDGHAVPDHDAAPGTDQLTRVLAAAAAPTRDGELAGEQMAMAAFAANHLATSVTPATPQKEHTSMLAKIFTAKVLFSSLAAFATGGVALAASTGALSSHPAAVTAPKAAATIAPTVSASAVPATTAPSATPSALPTSSAVVPLPTASSSSTVPSAQPSASASSTAASLPTTANGLCKALAGDLSGTLNPTSLLTGLSKTSLAQTLTKNSSEFSSLITTAGSVANVSDYCALLLDLPQLPDPSQLAQLPSALLGQLLTALPTATLASDLTSLPTSVLSEVLSALPTSALSTVLTSLPASVLSQLLSALPTSAVSQLLTELPSSVLSQVLAELPTSLLTQLPSSLLGQL